MKKILFTIYYLLLTTGNVFAQKKRTTGDTGSVELYNPLGRTSDIVTLLNNIINALTVYVAAPVAVLMIIIGAFQILSAGGSPEKLQTGKRTIVYALVGFAILISAKLIINLIDYILKGS